MLIVFNFYDVKVFGCFEISGFPSRRQSSFGGKQQPLLPPSATRILEAGWGRQYRRYSTGHWHDKFSGKVFQRTILETNKVLTFFRVSDFRDWCQNCRLWPWDLWESEKGNWSSGWGDIVFYRLQRWRVWGYRHFSQKLPRNFVPAWSHSRFSKHQAMLIQFD